MKKEFNINALDGTGLFCRKDIPDDAKAIIVIIHGFAEHHVRYNYFVEKLIENGYGCYRFDNRGHGKSGGEILDLKDYNDYVNDANLIVEKAKEEYPNLPIFMFGHSMGGFITALYGEKYPNKLRGQILSGAATDEPLQASSALKVVINIGNKIFPKLRVKNDLSALISRDKEVIEKYRNDPLIHDKATIRFFKQFIIEGVSYIKSHLRDYSYDCLVLHGKEDKIISYKSSEFFYNNISSKNKKMKVYEKSFHEILNEEDKDIVITDVINWLEEKICN